MSAPGPPRCLFCRAGTLATRRFLMPSRPARWFHSTRPARGDNDGAGGANNDSSSSDPSSSSSASPASSSSSSSSSSVSSRERRLKATPAVIRELARELPRYTPAELAQLAQKYTPEQLAAIRAGEAGIRPADLAAQAAVRRDPLAFEYLDDFALLRPGVDRARRAPDSNYDPHLRVKDEEEVLDEWARFYDALTDRPDVSDAEARVLLRRFEDEHLRWTTGLEAAERAPVSYLAPPVPRLPPPGSEMLDSADDEPEPLPGRGSGTDGGGGGGAGGGGGGGGSGSASETRDPVMTEAIRRVGITGSKMPGFRVRSLVCHRVVNQTRMGKIQSYYVLAVAGDGKGLLGLGEGKSAESEDARSIAQRAAILNMQPVPRYEKRTVYGEVDAKVAASIVTLSARPPGFGLRCQQYIYEICRCVGITDISAKVTRSRNPMNVVKATFAALQRQRLPETIALARGKKFIDVRKVYYDM